MCSFVFVGVFVILLLLLISHGMQLHESYVSMSVKWNKPIEKDFTHCTEDPQKCCPGLFHYPPEQCSGFEFARPSHFNSTMAVAVSPSAQSPMLPACKVNRITPVERTSLSVPRNVMFGSKTFDTMLGDEASVQMQKLCHISTRADNVQKSVDQLEQTIATDNTKAEQNQTSSQRLNGRHGAQQNRAKHTWDAYCNKYTYKDPHINQQCHALAAFTAPVEGATSTQLPTGV